jgi:hypothetical protein
MRRALVCLGWLGVLLGLPGCGSVRETAPLRGDLTLEDAWAFDEFPLYFAGERVDGLPLVAILRRSDTANYVSFVYGDCTPMASDQGCAPPAEIQVWPGCSRPAGHYDEAAPGAAPVPERVRIRGVPGAFFDDGTRLELYARGLTIVVFARSRADALGLAGALRSVKQPAAGGDLPAPERGGSEGVGSC